MDPNSVRTTNLLSPEGFIINTDFECGHGIATIASDGVVEVEMIAQSKAARYVCIEVVAEKDCLVRLRIVPDRQYKVDLASFHTWIWVMRGDSGKWLPLEKEQMQLHLSHIDLNIQLQKGEKITLSSEMALPYSKTCEWLKTLDGQHGFELVEIGRSVEQRPIYCLQRLGDEKEKPVVLVLAGEHGTEFAGEFVARGMLTAVMEDSAAGAQLRQRYNWGFVINCNPDGNVNGWHQYNRTDWRKHAYPFPEDISWHHEYEPYLHDSEEDVAPEAVAISTWVLRNKPSFIFNMHSWQGNNGNIGAYRAGTTMKNYPEMMAILDQIGEEIATSFGDDILFLRKDSGNLASGHLGDTLSRDARIPGCSPEAHMIVGEDHLRHFGTTWLQRGLLDDVVYNQLVEVARQVGELYQVFPAAKKIDTTIG